MIEGELIKIWQSSPNQERIKFERSRLIIEAQASLDSVQRVIKYANVRGTIAAVILIPWMAFYIYIMPFTLSKIASGLGVLFAINAFIRFRKANKNKPRDFTGTYLEYLYTTRSYLYDQKQLIDTVLYWSIIPGISISILFVIGFMELHHFTIVKIIFIGMGFIVVGILTYMLNKWWVQKYITPNLKKVEELISALKESQTDKE